MQRWFGAIGNMLECLIEDGGVHLCPCCLNAMGLFFFWSNLEGLIAENTDVKTDLVVSSACSRSLCHCCIAGYYTHIRSCIGASVEENLNFLAFSDL